MLIFGFSFFKHQQGSSKRLDGFLEDLLGLASLLRSAAQAPEDGLDAGPALRKGWKEAISEPFGCRCFVVFFLMFQKDIAWFLDGVGGRDVIMLVVWGGFCWYLVHFWGLVFFLFGGLL